MRWPAMMRLTCIGILAQFALLLLAFGVLTYCFLISDFSVIYVAQHSYSLLSWELKLAAVWGGHEGSLLLWVLLLSAWSALFAWHYRQQTDPLFPLTLAVLSLMLAALLLFVVLWSDPFVRIFPPAIEGRDLNPMLQHPGLIFHPPLLYLGYGGLMVAASVALASLLRGEFDGTCARICWRWALPGWSALTAGIILGSWWAYCELGWGGWWFWDPVENASLMPWLAGTALMHSLAVTEKRGSFKAWTVLLAIAAFSLCLLGTFLVRSGVLVSVHSFASDPARGMFILALLVIAIGGSLLLYAVKGNKVRARVKNDLWSRETFLLGNNILLMAAMLVVLLGTLLPLVHKQLGLGSISIGEPFFNMMFTAMMVPFALLLGIGPLVRWRRDEPGKVLKRLGVAVVITLAGALLLPWLMQDRIEAMTVVGLMMAIWVFVLALMELHERATHRHSFLKGLTKISRSQWGMVLGHVGLAVTVVGIAFSQSYSVERDVRMKAGDRVDIHQYQFIFKEVREVSGPNWRGGVGVIDVLRNGKPEATLHAEKRFYNSNMMMMTEAAIDGGVTRDLYAALGEELDDGSWAVRLYYKPFVRWIWYGWALMALGGLLSMLDPRYRLRKALQEA